MSGGVTGTGQDIVNQTKLSEIVFLVFVWKERDIRDRQRQSDTREKLRTRLLFENYFSVISFLLTSLHQLR